MRAFSCSAHSGLIAATDAQTVRSWAFAEGEELAPGRHAVRLLGGGHRYEAYLAWDDLMRSLVVAKLVRPDQVDDDRARAALAHEARLLERLAHPLLVRSFGASTDGERPHLVLEFVEGPRLSTLIRRFGVVLEQALPLALNVSAVLHYLAARGIVHLDVKPRNLIMAGAPRLIDLSVARELDRLGELRTPVGTDAYMAPEQCQPERFADIGPASDVWGLGVTLFEALTGRLPYPRPRPELPFPQLIHEPEALDTDLPLALQAVLVPCLERNPLNRPSAAQVGDALEPLVESLPAPRIGKFRPGARDLERRLELT
jgi:eukaryotic-like serine/threonine-protein kinase